MRKPLNRIGAPLLSGVLLLSVAFPATAQLYGAGRNSGAVVIDEDVLSTLGGGAPRPGVGIGYLPAPATPPRSKINQIPPPKPKPAPVPVVATPAPVPVAPPPAAAPVSAPPAPAPAPAPVAAVPVGASPDAPAIPASAPPLPLTPEPAPPPQMPQTAAKPQAPKPDPGPPPVPAEPPPAPKVAAIAPPPPPAPAPVATPAVAVPAPVATAKGVRLLFLPDSSDVPTTARPALDGVVKQLQGQPDRRVLITAYAAGTPETASQSRRLSLNRALAVRSFLAESGVSTARVDVRALGSQVGDGPADRVDLDLITP